MRVMTLSTVALAAAFGLSGCAHQVATSAPAPVYAGGAPVYRTPPPVYAGGPVPSYGQPVPSRGQPVPAYGGQPAPGYYPAPQSQVAYANVGHVENIEVLRAESRTTGGGALLGGVIGAVAGRNIVGHSDRAAGTIVGAAAGALIGNQVEKNNKQIGDAYRVTIRMHDGSTRVFDYTQLNDLRIGERVRVDGNQVYRL